jgi:hypothetical protein
MAPSPSPSSSSSKLDRQHRKIEKERKLADGKGGKQPNLMTARKPDIL